MKRIMKNKWKRSLAGLLCASMLVFCMIPVSAWECTSHSLDKAGVVTNVINNTGNHTIVTYQRYACKCGYSIKVEIDRVDESHDLTFTNERYDSEGNYHYTATCHVCGFQINF